MTNEILNDSRLVFLFTFSGTWFISIIVAYIFLIKLERNKNSK